MGLAHTLTLADGRTLGFDDVGDPAGVPILYVHGTPDSRRARHPDDGLSADRGVRLVALDRPGFGLSSPHRAATVGSFADDAIALADHLGIDRWRPFAWSGGATYAAAVAARHPARVERAAIAAGLVPFAAYATPGILDDADGGRHLVADLGTELGPAGMAEIAAPMLAPHPCDEALAREHLLETADPRRRADLESIAGAADVLVAGLVDAVAQGLDGLIRDLELQVEPPDVDWRAITCRVDLWYGERDTTAPVAFGRWWAGELTDAALHVQADAGHLVALTHWAEIIDCLAS